MNTAGLSSSDRRPTLIAAGLIALLLLSTLGHGGARPGVLLAWHALTVVLLVVALVFPAACGTDTRRIAPMALGGFAIFATVAVIGAVLAPYGYAAWLLLLELGAFLAVGVLAARCGPRLLDRLPTPLLALAVVLGSFALWQRFALEVPRPAATFLNPNHLAGWIVAVLLLATGAAVGLDRPSWKCAAPRSLAALLLLGVLLVTGSRGAFLGLFVGLVVLGVLNRHRLPRALKIGAGAACLFVVLLAAGSQGLRLRESDPFRYQRVRIWQSSLRVVQEQPWTGTGPRQFAAASRHVQFADGDGPLRYDRSFSFPHSDLLRIPCEFGWPGVAAFVLAVLAAGRVVYLRRRDGKLGPAGVGAVAALAGLSTQALIDHVTHRPAMYLLGALLLGALTSRFDASPSRYPAWLRLGLAVLILTVFAVGDMAPYLAWRETDDLPRGRLNGVEQQRLARALELNPVHPEYWSRRAEHLAAEGGELDLDTYARAREAAERAVRLQPADAEYRRQLARVEAQGCRYLFRDAATRERARGEFAEASRLAPYDPFILLELGSFLLDTGDPQGARRAAERVLGLEPESVVPRLLLAEALMAYGAEGAEQQAERLMQEARQRATRWIKWVDRGPYPRELLQLDSRAVSRLRQALDRPGTAAEPGRP